MKVTFLALMVAVSAHAAPSDGFSRLAGAFPGADRVTQADMERNDTAVGRCFVKQTNREATGTYRYEDSGTRYRALRVPEYRFSTYYSAGGAILTSVPRRGNYNAIVEFLGDANSSFVLSSVGGANTRAALAFDKPVRHQSNYTSFSADGMLLSQRNHSHWGRFVDTASYFDWGFQVKSSTLGSKHRVLVMRQYCLTGVCPGGHEYSVARNADVRYCVLVPVSGESEINAARAIVDEVIGN